MTAIDLNADVGEMDAALDARILEIVSSVSVACGGHAGRRCQHAAGHRRGRWTTCGSERTRRSSTDRASDAPATMPLSGSEESMRDQILRLADNSPACPPT